MFFLRHPLHRRRREGKRTREERGEGKEERKGEGKEEKKENVNSEKRKGEEGNDSAPGGAAPRRGPAERSRKVPQQPLEGWGTLRDQASWEKDSRDPKKSCFFLPGLDGLTRNVRFANFDAPVLGMRS